MELPLIFEVSVARITRKEMKTDRFAQEVGLTVTFFEEHRKELARYGGIAVVVALLVVGYVLYQRREHGVREQALTRAIQVQEAPVGAASAAGGLAFPTQEAKDQEALRIFTDLRNKYAGSVEGEIAEYYLGAVKADQGKLLEAEKSFLQVAQKGDDKYAPLAKLSVAQIYFADGRSDLGEKTLRELIAKPTIYVSQEQAAITLARYIMLKKPAEARKLLDPLRNRPGTVGQVALQAYGEIPPQ
jgi:predicted negative regulator of RcsB-dependent stress response